MHRTRLGAVCLLLALAPACIDTGSGSGGQPTSGTFAIGFLGDISGSDRSAVDAASLAVDEANRSAPDGVTFALRPLGTDGNPARAADRVVSLAGIESVVALVVTPAVVSQISRLEMPVLVPRHLDAAPPPGSRARYLGAPPEAEIRAVASFVAEDLGASQAALLVAGDPAPMRDALLAAGVGVPVAATIDPTAGDYQDVVASTRAASPIPDVVVYDGPADAGGRLALALTEGGVRSRMVGGASILRSDFVTAGPPGTVEATGARAVCLCVGVSAGDEGARGSFATSYEGVTQGRPYPWDAETFAAVKLLLDGVLAGHTTRAALGEHLASQEAVDVLGTPVGLDGTDGPVATTVFGVSGSRWVPVGA